MQPPLDPVPPFFGMAAPPGEIPPDGIMGTPSAVVWFKVYAALMAVVYLAVFGLGMFMALLPSFLPHSGAGPTDEPLVVGLIYAIFGAGLGVPFAIALFLRPKRWVWTYNLVLILFGMLSCACWPIAIPLLIYWLKPEVKAHFHEV